MALNPTDKELFALVLQVEDQLEQEGLHKSYALPSLRKRQWNAHAWSSSIL